MQVCESGHVPWPIQVTVFLVLHALGPRPLSAGSGQSSRLNQYLVEVEAAEPISGSA